MEKGPSTYAEYWTSPYNEVKHFNDHGWQMGFENDFIGYSEAAKNLALSEADDVLAFVRKDGYVCKFNTTLRHFIVVNRGGKIVSFYKADIKYFLSEFNKKGLYKLKGEF